MAIRRLPAAFAALALLAACSADTARCILPEGVRLRPGDLVFRRGNGLTSRAVIAADRNGLYSHVGIVVDSCGKMMIVHAVPGEPDYKGDPDRVKMDTPEKFFSSINACAGEVKRLQKDTAAAGEAARLATELYSRGVLFDHDYNDSDTTKMYCCELVMHVYAKAGVAITGSVRHEFRLPGLGLIRCVLPSDICNNTDFTTVISF